MNGKPWILIEPYYGGSHRHLVDGLLARLPFPCRLWTLPARKWKWRMRGAALHFAERWRAERPDAAGIFTSSMLDAAALRGLLPQEARILPMHIYYHENQLRYPVRVKDKRDFHYAWTNIQSAAAADLLLWNSAYNRDSFLEELPAFMKRLPDARIGGLDESIRAKSSILPVPLDLTDLARRSRERGAEGGACRLLWNHRWEHDKGPELFFDAVLALAAEGLDFELSVLGESFQEVPDVFPRAREALAGRVRHWAFLESRVDYEEELLSADIVVSTARHEFQGLSVLEAAAAGAKPLVPDDLAYPEIWPEDCRYRPGNLLPALRDAIRGRDEGDTTECRDIALRFDWTRLLPAWIDAFKLT